MSPIVSEQYQFVIGVDTHAATHTLAVLCAATGAVLHKETFPTSSPGLGRALGWVARRIGEARALIVVEGLAGGAPIKLGGVKRAKERTG